MKQLIGVYMETFENVNSYSRTLAVEYAKKYALNPNPQYRYFSLSNTGGDCANFLSQCLKAGGAPFVYNREHSWWYNNMGTGNVMDDTWSIPWAVAHSLYWFLKINNESNLSGAKGREISDISLLDLGDLVFYEDNSGLIFHSAIITGFRGNIPLVSHHSFEALNIPYYSTWPANKIHFLKIHL